MPKYTLYNAIGEQFEEILQRQFPNFQKTPETEGELPDFSGPLHIEAKTGFILYGAQIKEKQIRNFRSPDGKPIIYAIGFHNLANSRALTNGMDAQETRDFIRENMGIDCAYLVSNRIMNSLWRREHKIPKSGSERKYYSIKPRHLEAIIQNKKIKRSGKLHTVSRYYGIKRPDLFLKSATALGGAQADIEFGAVIHRSDLAAVDYFQRERSLAA